VKLSKDAKKQKRFDRFLRYIRRRHLDRHDRWMLEAYDYFAMESMSAYYDKAMAEIDAIHAELRNIEREFGVKLLPDSAPDAPAENIFLPPQP